MPARKVLTLHAPMHSELFRSTVQHAREYFDTFNVSTWLDHSEGTVVLWADLHEEWHHRSPTPREWAIAQQLMVEGKHEELYELVAKGGLPPHER